jgi:hypothetical protein
MQSPQKAKDLTFKAPGGQLHGRAGRRCVLEDGAHTGHGQQCSSAGQQSTAFAEQHAYLAAGERVLLQCLRVNPSGIEARTTLMYNLTAQNR